MGSVRFVGEKDRRRAGSIAEATYVDADGITVSIELSVDEAGRLFELDFWKVDFSPLRLYPSPELVVEFPIMRRDSAGSRSKCDEVTAEQPKCALND
jgi:hypothetical protein